MRQFLQLILILLFIYPFNSSHANDDMDWIVYLQNNEITIEYKRIDCEFVEQFNQQYIMLKITNHSNKDILVRWDQELWYDNQCINCEQFSEEYRKNIVVNANEMVIGNCIKNNPLRIFSKFTDALKDMPGVNEITELTKFELKNINIEYE